MTVLPQYEGHPASAIFPMMEDSELAELTKDIHEHGLVESIEVFEGKILDGRNRLLACERAGVEPRFLVLQNISSPTLYVMSKNLHRRHLTTSQRAAIAAEVMPLLQAEAKERQQAGGKKGGETAGVGRPKSNSLPVDSPEPYSTNEIKGETREIAGKAAGVGGTTVQKAINVKRADPGEFERVKRGEITVEAAHRKVRGAEPVTKRQQQIENAAKRRMVDMLSNINGFCKALRELKISDVVSVCSPEEVRTWVSSTRESMRELRKFAALLSSAGRELKANEEICKTEDCESGGPIAADSSSRATCAGPDQGQADDGEAGLDAIGADSSRSAGAIPPGTGGAEAGSCRSPQDELRFASRRRGGPLVNDHNLQARKGGTKR